MLNFIYLFLSFGFAFLNPAHSIQSDVGVTDDFKLMLGNPNTPKTHESFATQPFAQNPSQDHKGLLLSNTAPVDQEQYKKLVLATKTKDWQQTDVLLRQFPVGSGDTQQQRVIETIRRLTNYHLLPEHERDPNTPESDLFRQDVQTVNRAVTQFFRPPSLISPAVKISEYIAESPVLKLYAKHEKERMSKVLREALSTRVAKNGNQWPGLEQIKVAEEFFWNLYQNGNNEEVIAQLFQSTIPGNWKDFSDLCASFNGQHIHEKRELLPVYLAFLNVEDRQRFLTFCEQHYTADINRYEKLYILKALLPIYIKLPNAEDRVPFWAFCGPYINDESIEHITSVIKNLFPIYLEFPSEQDQDRASFLAFCEPYINSLSLAFQKPVKMAYLLSIYKAFPDPTARKEFEDFCKSYFPEDYDQPQKPFHMLNFLLPVYKELPPSHRHDFKKFVHRFLGLKKSQDRGRFSGSGYLGRVPQENIPKIVSDIFSIYREFLNSSNEQRERFIDSFREDLVGVNTNDRPSNIKDLLLIYQAFPEEGAAKNAFIDFCRLYFGEENYPTIKNRKDMLLIYQSGQKEDFEESVRYRSQRTGDVSINRAYLSSYLSRAYLRYMRVDGALKSEPENRDRSRIQAMYETENNNPLPVFWAHDLFLAHANQNITANAHDFDAVYELDRPILWGETAGHNSTLSSTSRTIYNNSGQMHNYHANTEVEDFIDYLDTTIARGDGIKVDSLNLDASAVTSIIKQMLGLEPKNGNTTGGFAPYLGSSMYYAKPESPKGDEMLGRTWFYMKKIAKNDQDLKLNKRAVVLALLEAAEISQASIDTHCQTRTTGELMKLVAWHLPDSHLRPLIAGTDLPPAQSDADIQTRIDTAPLRAQQLFGIMKREDAGAIKKSIDKQLVIDGESPQLWQRYEAYYDDLYRRTKTEDGAGYRLDENILMRDSGGNLVRTLNRGTPDQRTEVVYYQAEFQVFEKTFTELMRKEFEEQRGLKY